MRRRPLATALALSLAVCLAGPAPRSRAHADPPRASITTRAKAHFKQGRAHQEAGSFDAAIAEYLEAYRLAPRPELLFNIAQCHRLAGHARRAIELYRRFLEDAPEGTAADEARTHVATLQKQLDAEPTPPAAPSPAAPGPGPIAASATPSHPALDLDVAPRPTPTRGRGFAWLGVAGVVGGAALVGTGAYLGWRAADEADALAAATEWSPALDAREEAAQADEQRMWYLVGGGTALLLGGGALWWWASRPRSIEAVPAVSPDRAGVVVRGAF